MSGSVPRRGGADDHYDIDSRDKAIIALNYDAACGTVGKCYARHDAAMDLVSGIMQTLRFEWV